MYDDYINTINNPKLSVLLVGIRDHLWTKLFYSIGMATTAKFELIIVSPKHVLPNKLLQYGNIKFLSDYGQPMRCAQIASQLAEGEILLTLMSDDGVYLPDSIDKALKEFNQQEHLYKKVLSCKYFEGPNGYTKPTQPPEYYNLNYHKATRLHCIPNDWNCLVHGFITRKYFEELGGWDCRYESVVLGLADLAIRIQRDKVKIPLSDTILVDCDWSPGDTKDHGPIYYAQTEHDEPLYQEIYKYGLDNLPIKINQNNWKNTKKIWQRRWS